MTIHEVTMHFHAAYLFPDAGQGPVAIRVRAEIAVSQWPTGVADRQTRALDALVAATPTVPRDFELAPSIVTAQVEAGKDKGPGDC